MNLDIPALNIILWLSPYFQIYTNLSFRGEDQERRSEEVPISSVAPAVYSESGPHTCSLGMGLGESSVEEPLGKDINGDPVLTLNVPEVKGCKI